MTKHKLLYYPYTSFTNALPSLLKVAALYFDRLVILDPVGASWVTIGAYLQACEAVKRLHLNGLRICDDALGSCTLMFAGSPQLTVRTMAFRAS